jgi:hypothetical protein
MTDASIIDLSLLILSLNRGTVCCAELPGTNSALLICYHQLGIMAVLPTVAAMEAGFVVSLGRCPSPFVFQMCSSSLTFLQG